VAFAPLRYDLSSVDLLDVCAYEAQRLFRDRLVDDDHRGTKLVSYCSMYRW
jgi:hypothetical protein